jgi:hypothetical protein
MRVDTVTWRRECVGLETVLFQVYLTLLVAVLADSRVPLYN